MSPDITARLPDECGHVDNIQRLLNILGVERDRPEKAVMSKFVAIIIPNETKAYEATRALKELHTEGSLVLYGQAVLAKDSAGNISVKDAASSGPLGTAVGALAGGLIGLIGGPVGAAIGLTSGALIGSVSDLFNAGVSAGFVKSVADALAPGKVAIVAEISEDWVTPLDTRMSALGGTVIRTFRADVEQDQIEKEIAAQKAGYERLKVEYAQAADDAKKTLSARVTEAQNELKDAVNRARDKAEALKKETEAKIATLREQASVAGADAQRRVDEHIAAVRADYEKRSAKLEQAWTLAKDALS